jgi:hypothetical protein
MIARDGRATARKVRQLARNAWNEDAAADRRAREMERRSLGQSQGPLRSPYRARPEVYDPDVVTAFANAIAQAAEQPQFSWTRRVDSNKSGGVMLDVLVAAVDWAMCSARLGAGAARSKPVRVKAEGLLRIIKAARRT